MNLHRPLETSCTSWSARAPRSFDSSTRLITQNQNCKPWRYVVHVLPVVRTRVGELQDTLESLNHALLEQQPSLPDAVQDIAALLAQQCSNELRALEQSAVKMTRSMQDVHTMLSTMAARLLEIKANEQHIKETQVLYYCRL